MWQTPGPAAAGHLRQVLASRRVAEAALQAAAGRHGVPYTPNLLKALSSGRLPALPTDAARQGASSAAAADRADGSGKPEGIR